MQGRERKMTEWSAIRLRQSERDLLRAAARKVGKLESELAREAIGDRVSDILGSGIDNEEVAEVGGDR